MPTVSLEIELELEGSVTPYRPATWMDPAEGGEVEDLAIADAGVLELVPAPEKDRASHRRIWARKSFLTGVDTSNPEVQKLLTNLLNLVWEPAEDAVREAADDGYDPDAAYEARRDEEQAA